MITHNDAYGFNNGDIMIQAVANSMAKCCNNEVFQGHIGGDDFVMIASLSLSAITNKKVNYESIEDLSIAIARVKKICKQTIGDFILIE